MAMPVQSASGLLATPVQVNQQVKTNLQPTAPQVAQDTQKAAKTAQTDTITISAQALKMTDDRNAVTKNIGNTVDEQKALRPASDKSDSRINAAQRNAVKAYSAVSGQQ